MLGIFAVLLQRSQVSEEISRRESMLLSLVLLVSSSFWLSFTATMSSATHKAFEQMVLARMRLGRAGEVATIQPRNAEASSREV